VLRANRAEVAALGGGPEPVSLALATGTVVAATGAVDIVTDGTRTHRLMNGTPLMDRVTAMGCAASGLVGAFLAVERRPLLAAAAALLVLGVAGEAAAGRARGPGTLVPELLDELFALDLATLRARARVA
jgi:hydroxyethylthiazole kinase